jgi:CDP-diacylglycerol---serine O-phosphatidyltransferase
MKNRRILKMALKERFYRRRFLLPNAVTLGNMFCGFIACIYAAAGHFEKAVLSIGFAILLDGLDGRVARRFNATSKFGVEFDSFSDLISFGVAPAILSYYWAFQTHADQFGVFVVFIFALCAASRLARFNISQEDLKKFVGMPTPGAAAMVAAVVNYYPHPQHGWTDVIWVSALVLLLAYLMVSRIEFFSVKTLRIGSLKLVARIGVGALIALIWYDTQTGFLVLGACYCLSGPFNLVRSIKKPKLEAASQE